MEWTRLLSTKRQRPGRHQDVRSADTDLRSEFEKDYHRIIGSASFRRLQDKTQVFPLDKSDFIRTRLTHSMEVSSLAKSLGQNIGESILAHKKDTSFTPVIYALSDFLIMILSWLVKQSLRAFLFQEVQP